MPKMSYEGEMVDCVVCPVLAKKAKKQLKAQMKLEAMKQEANAVRLEEQREPTEEKAQQEERTESTEILYTEEELLLLATLESPGWSSNKNTVFPKYILIFGLLLWQHHLKLKIGGLLYFP